MARKKKVKVVYTATSRTEAENVAQGYRKALKKDGLPWRGVVKIRKSQNNFVVVHEGDLPKGRHRRYY